MISHGAYFKFELQINGNNLPRYPQTPIILYKKGKIKKQARHVSGI
jgi:hypothetical protein